MIRVAVERGHGNCSGTSTSSVFRPSGLKTLNSSTLADFPGLTRPPGLLSVLADHLDEPVKDLVRTSVSAESGIGSRRAFRQSITPRL